MAFPVPPSGGYYQRWLTDLLALGRDSQATTLKGWSAAELDDNFVPGTHTELAVRYQTAIRIRNELARSP